MGQKVVTIAQQKGGSGKTTIVAHVAVALMERGFRVALIDVDPQASLARWHAVREERFGEGNTGLTFSALSGWRVGGEVARLRRNHDIVLIDSPPHVEAEARTALRHADQVIIPVQPSPTDLWATMATVELARVEEIPAHIVLNRVNPQSRIYERVRDELREMLLGTLCNRVVYAASLMEGFGVTEAAPASAGAEEIKHLALRIANLLKHEGTAPVKRVRSEASAEIA